MSISPKRCSIARWIVPIGNNNNQPTYQWLFSARALAQWFPFRNRNLQRPPRIPGGNVTTLAQFAHAVLHCAPLYSHIVGNRAKLSFKYTRRSVSVHEQI